MCFVSSDAGPALTSVATGTQSLNDSVRFDRRDTTHNSRYTSVAIVDEALTLFMRCCNWYTDSKLPPPFHRRSNPITYAQFYATDLLNIEHHTFSR